MKIKTIYTTIFLFLIFSGLSGCYKHMKDTPQVVDTLSLNPNQDGSLTVRDKKTNKVIKFEPCGNKDEAPCPSTKLGRGYSTNVQFLQFTFFEKDIKSVRCCIEYGSPGNQGFYCETFSRLNSCPSPFK
jgi:hypothetical protein